MAKVGEAEVMLGAQPPDILVEYPVIGRGKVDRLAQVAKSAKVTVRSIARRPRASFPTPAAMPAWNSESSLKRMSGWAASA